MYIVRSEVDRTVDTMRLADAGFGMFSVPDLNNQATRHTTPRAWPGVCGGGIGG